MEHRRRWSIRFEASCTSGMLPDMIDNRKSTNQAYRSSACYASTLAGFKTELNPPQRSRLRMCRWVRTSATTQAVPTIILRPPAAPTHEVPKEGLSIPSMLEVALSQRAGDTKQLIAKALCK